MDLVKLSLIISISGIFFFLFLLATIQPKLIFNYQELKQDEYVQVEGKIASIRNYYDFYILQLDNNITLTCTDCNFSKGEKIIVKGKVTRFDNSLQIQAEEISYTRS